MSQHIYFLKRRPVLTCIIAAGVTIAALFAVCIYHFGSVSSAFAYADGRRVVIGDAVPQPATKTGERPFRFTVKNMNDDAVTIVGVAFSCSCMTTDELPVEIGPGESCDFRVVVSVSPGQSRIQERVTFYTSDARLPILVGKIDAQCKTPNRSETEVSQNQER